MRNPGHDTSNLEHCKQQSEKLKVVTDSTVRKAWTSQVDKRELHSNFTNNWRGIVGKKIEICMANSTSVAVSITAGKVKVT